MKKICFFMSDIGGRGGTERVTSIIANMFINNGEEVHILSIFSSNNYEFTIDSSIIVKGILNENEKGKLSKKFFPVSTSVVKYIKKNKIDVLINVGSMLFLFSFIARLLTNVHCINWEHNHYKYGFGINKLTIARILAKLVAHDVVTLTKKDKTNWEKTYPRGYAKIHCINNPAIIKNREVFSSKKKVFLAVGHLVYSKNFIRLLDIWCEYQKYNSEWTLKIVGDGPEKLSLLNKIRIEKINNVEIVGFVNPIEPMFHLSSVMLMTSRSEGLPMVLLEALCHSLPIIAFDCDTGPAEIIENEKNGFLIKYNDDFAFLHAMKKISGCDEMRRKMAQTAFESCKRFECSAVFSQWLKLLK